MTLLSAVAIAEKRNGKIGERIYAGRAGAVLERGWISFKSSTYMVVISGFVEPLLNLFVFGFGVGQFVGDVQLPNGTSVSYASFIVPGLLATAAMMGAIMDSTWNVFFKMHEAKLYNAMLSTSMGPMDVALGEIIWALMRGALYSTSFMAVVSVFGLIHSWWALMCIPAGVVIGFAFASIGFALTSYIKGFHQLSLINIFLLPITLFSGSFFPLNVMPHWLAAVVRWSPLTQGIDLMRIFTFGTFTPRLIEHLVYFTIFIAAGLVFATRRLNALFMK